MTISPIRIMHTLNITKNNDKYKLELTNSNFNSKFRIKTTRTLKEAIQAAVDWFETYSNARVLNILDERIKLTKKSKKEIKGRLKTMNM